MSTAYQIVVRAGTVPDPLQTLEPGTSPTGPALKNEMMLRAELAQARALIQQHGYDRCREELAEAEAATPPNIAFPHT